MQSRGARRHVLLLSSCMLAATKSRPVNFRGGKRPVTRMVVVRKRACTVAKSWVQEDKFFYCCLALFAATKSQPVNFREAKVWVLVHRGQDNYKNGIRLWSESARATTEFRRSKEPVPEHKPKMRRVLTPQSSVHRGCCSPGPTETIFHLELVP